MEYIVSGINGLLGEPVIFIYLIFGIFMGMVMGAIPGLTASLAVTDATVYLLHDTYGRHLPSNCPVCGRNLRRSDLRHFAQHPWHSLFLGHLL